MAYPNPTPLSELFVKALRSVNPGAGQGSLGPEDIILNQPLPEGYGGEQVPIFGPPANLATVTRDPRDVAPRIAPVDAAMFQSPTQPEVQAMADAKPAVIDLGTVAPAKPAVAAPTTPGTLWDPAAHTKATIAATPEGASTINELFNVARGYTGEGLNKIDDNLARRDAVVDDRVGNVQELLANLQPVYQREVPEDTIFNRLRHFISGGQGSLPDLIATREQANREALNARAAKIFELKELDAKIRSEGATPDELERRGELITDINASGREGMSQAGQTERNIFSEDAQTARQDSVNATTIQRGREADASAEEQARIAAEGQVDAAKTRQRQTPAQRAANLKHRVEVAERLDAIVNPITTGLRRESEEGLFWDGSDLSDIQKLYRENKQSYNLFKAAFDDNLNEGEKKLDSYDDMWRQQLKLFGLDQYSIDQLQGK